MIEDEKVDFEMDVFSDTSRAEKGSIKSAASGPLGEVYEKVARSAFFCKNKSLMQGSSWEMESKKVKRKGNATDAGDIGGYFIAADDFDLANSLGGLQCKFDSKSRIVIPRGTHVFIEVTSQSGGTIVKARDLPTQKYIEKKLELHEDICCGKTDFDIQNTLSSLSTTSSTTSVKNNKYWVIFLYNGKDPMSVDTDIRAYNNDPAHHVHACAVWVDNDSLVKWELALVKEEAAEQQRIAAEQQRIAAEQQRIAEELAEQQRIVAALNLLKSGVSKDIVLAAFDGLAEQELDDAFLNLGL